MTLQPLIENYFKHGADVQPGKGYISIHSHLTTDHWVEIHLENNGSSIPEEKLIEIREWFREELSTSEIVGKETDENESIGLRNVGQRLRLNSSTEHPAIIDINNKEPHGVQIIVKIYAGE